MSTDFNDDFYLSFFNKVMEAIQGNVSEYGRCWFELAARDVLEDGLKSLSNFNALPDKDKIEYAKTMLLISFIFSENQLQISCKRIGAKNSSNCTIPIPISEEEKKEYMRYEQEVILAA